MCLEGIGFRERENMGSCNMARGCESGINSVLFSRQEKHGHFEDPTEGCFEQCLFVLHRLQPDSGSGPNTPVLSKQTPETPCLSFKRSPLLYEQ